MDRRTFNNRLLGFTGLATLGSIFYPVIRYLIPPKTAESTASSVVAASINEIPINGFKIVPFGGKPMILVRQKEKTFVALSAKCTHLDCIVQYKEDAKNIWCACHNGLYDLTGKNIAGPPPRPLQAFKVDLLGDKVVVSRV